MRKLLPDLRSVENTGNLQPAFTAIERRIIDPAGEAAAAIRAEVNRRAGNGVAEPHVAGVASVIDGDTIEVPAQRIRLHGIDAPESRQLCRLDGKPWQCGKDAKRPS